MKPIREIVALPLERAGIALEPLAEEHRGLRPPRRNRRHMVLPDGHIRDTVYFSLIREEWPAAKARIEERLASA